MEQLERSWHRAWSGLGLHATEGLRQRLIDAYNEPHRRYHSLQHLHECISHLEPAIGLANHPGEVEIALWFHDAIYELKAKDNEQRSAQWAVDELGSSGASSEQAGRVHSLIMATCHTAMPIEHDQQLLVDVDLSILGASPARFAEYDAQVKLEYSWVPSLIYRMKRKEVLKGFLDRASTYNTDHFKGLYEQQARTNLQSAIR
jgi:predicted metal-dependent HD superfamily phosphohydrolase